MMVIDFIQAVVLSGFFTHCFNIIKNNAMHILLNIYIYVYIYIIVNSDIGRPSVELP